MGLDAGEYGSGDDCMQSPPLVRVSIFMLELSLIYFGWSSLARSLTDRWRVLVCAVVEAGSGAMLRLRAMRVALQCGGRCSERELGRGPPCGGENGLDVV